MLASKNKYIQEASETIYKLSQKEKIRLQCEAREDYYRRQKSLQILREQQLAEIEWQNSEIERQNSEIERQNSEIERQNSEIEKQAAIIQQKESAYNDLLTWAKAHGYHASAN